MKKVLAMLLAVLLVVSFVACGSGGVTKLRDPGSDFLSRVFNFKYPYEYIGRFDEILKRKSDIKRFYCDLYS